MALAGLEILLELVQFFRAGRRYFQWTNFFDWIVYVFSFLFVLDLKEDAGDTGVREVRTTHSRPAVHERKIFPSLVLIVCNLSLGSAGNGRSGPWSWFWPG